MTVKKLITVPDDILRKNSQPIEKVSNNEKKLSSILKKSGAIEISIIEKQE